MCFTQCCILLVLKKKIGLIIINMHHKHTQFIFHHCGRPQRIEEMLMCPAAYLFDNRWSRFGSSGTLPASEMTTASSPCKYYQRKTNSQSNSSTDWLWGSHQLPLKHWGGGGGTRWLAVQNNLRGCCNFRCSLSMWTYCKMFHRLLLFKTGLSNVIATSMFASFPNQICYCTISILANYINCNSKPYV